MNERPNFLCIITDQQRADHLGCAGNSVLQTPNINRIASQGVRFENAFVSNPLCMPARATLFTGRNPRGHHVRTNGIPLSYDVPTMTEALRQSGYRTRGIGKMHLRPFRIPNGMKPEEVDPSEFPESKELWDNELIKELPSPYLGLEKVEFAGGHGSYHFGEYLSWLLKQEPQGKELLQAAAGTPMPNRAEQAWKSALPEELHCSKWVADHTIAFLKGAATQANPFFLWCSFPDPHHPYCPPAPWCDMYEPGSIPLPVRREGELENLPPHFKKIYEEGIKLSGRVAPTRMSDKQLREIMALTFGMVSLLDYHLGRVLDALEEVGLHENTVVVFMSDHGDMMGDHWLLNKGPFHFDGLLKIPFIWCWPKRFKSNDVNQALVSHLDFAPTLLELAGVAIPEGAAPLKPEAPAMSPAWPGVSLVPVLTGEKPAVRDSVLVENDEDYLGLRLRTLVTDDYQLTVYSGEDYGELFDRRNDPEQLHNLWQEPGARKLRGELQTRLLHELMLSDPPLPRRLSHA